MIKRIFLLLLLSAIGACGLDKDNSYYPLGDTSWWEYSIQYMHRGELKVQRQILANQPPVEVDGEKYFPRKSASNHIDYFQKTAEGIYHVDPVTGTKTWVLQLPVDIGREWEDISKISKLEMLGGAFTATYMARIQQPVTMTYRIESLDDNVVVNGNRYTNCLRVFGKGRLYAGSTLEEFVNISSINVETTDWYAPGVGLVKSIRKEFTSPKEFKNEYVKELLSHKRT